MNDEKTPTSCGRREVDRCVCFSVSFRTLREYAQKHRCGLDELTAHFGCGRGCGLCVPYIRRMLETGETSFALLPPQEGSRRYDSPP